ncbi:hypothetical protein ACLB2K_058026 [Fragaria x ananassa]
MPTLAEIQAQHNQQARSSNASYRDTVENVVYDNAPDTFSNVSHVDYNNDYDKYNRLLRQIQTSLYPDSEHNVLGTVMKKMKIKNKRGKINMMHIQQQFPTSYDSELHLLAGGPQSHRVRVGCFMNVVKFVTSERDEDHVTQNNRVMVEGLCFNYYGVLVSVIELIYDKGMPVVLFKCKWFNTDPTRRRSTILDCCLLSVDSNTTLGGDDESGPSKPTFDQPNELYHEESSYIVPDTEDICVNNQHVPAIIGYIPITPSELNSLQRNPNHDDDSFIDEEYIEDDDSDDSDYYEYD